MPGGLGGGKLPQFWQSSTSVYRFTVSVARFPQLVEIILSFCFF